ncbi:MAG: DUF1549 domain-containing protein [Phycisphaera sp.]|nr:DUF1549 domain-containing protein [Phycisphaera sp.]
MMREAMQNTTMWKRWGGLAAVMIIAATTLGTTLYAEDPAIDPIQIRFFETKVRPLLSNRCFECHGEKKHKADLRVDSLAGLVNGGKSGPAIERGNPDKSLMITAIGYSDPDLQMPPKKQLTADEVATLTEWVKLGAPWPGVDPTKLRPGDKFDDDDRAYWFFQPLKHPEAPKVNDGGWSTNAIDGFVFERLAAEGLKPAPRADRRTLIRRVYFDLIGLPPTPDEVDAFVNDTDPKAYEHLVDRLLASPQYGEKWARHWLDLVRYAESDGYKADHYRPTAWRYRDYVINAFNADKPYNEFVREQIAGDEIDPTDPQNLVAVSYMRHGIYEYNQRDARTQRDVLLQDITDVTADAFLALGFGCAKCHDHKYDPILQKDYFRLKAFFAPLRFRDDIPLANPIELAKYRSRMSEWEEKTGEIRKQIDAIESVAKGKAEQKAVVMFPPDVQDIYNKPVAERTNYDQQIHDLVFWQVEYEWANLSKYIKGDDSKKLNELKQQLKQFESLKPADLPEVRTVRDAMLPIAPTTIPDDRTHRSIEPGFLSILDPDPAKITAPKALPESSGRRLALANWLTQPDNQLTTRVIVNRIWQHHLGTGIVATPSDFGRLGTPPTHPQLLDYLATWFVEHGWSIKRLHRLIMLSSTYCQAADVAPSEVAAMKDPKNDLLWRQNIRRLDAEQVRDAILAVSGDLDLAFGGPGVDGTRGRRSIYVKVLRNHRDSMLDAFDFPDCMTSSAQRNVTTTSTQALLMVNGDWVLSRARSLAAKLDHVDGDDARIDAAYQLMFGRAPSESERITAIHFLKVQEQRALGKAAAEPKPAAKPAADKADNTNKLAATFPRRNSVAALIKEANNTRIGVPDNDSMPTDDFTIEAYFMLESLYPDATVRTIASKWDNNTGNRGWAFGVTSTKSAYEPRNLIIQLIGDTADAGVKYRVIASNLRPKLNTPYYAAASVNVTENNNRVVTFYLKDLSTPEAPLQTATIEHDILGGHANDYDLLIGARDHAKARHFWDGLIDEVRLSTGALDAKDLLINGGEAEGRVVGHWTFEDSPGFLVDSSTRHNNLATHVVRADDSHNANTSARRAALIDFCHALMNSNEFIYVD